MESKHYPKSITINPKVVVELQTEPTAERAQRVMLLTLPTGKTIPVNYLKEGNTVFVGADGRWWREFRDKGKDVEFFLQGAALNGRAVAITNDPEYRDEVFSRLRPTAPAWFPEWLKGHRQRLLSNYHSRKTVLKNSLGQGHHISLLGS